MIQVVNPGANLSFNNVVYGYVYPPSYNGVLTKSGSGTLTLGGSVNNSTLTVAVQQGALVLAKLGSGTAHAASAINGVSPGALLQMGGIANGDPNGGGQINGGVNNMNGTFDFNGMSEGLLGLNGTGTVTNNAASTTSVMTFGYVPGGSTSGGSDAFAGVIADGQGVMALAVSGGGLLALSRLQHVLRSDHDRGGTLVLAAPSAASPNSNYNVNANNGLLFGSGVTAGTIGGLSGSGNVALTSSDGLPVSLSVGANNASAAYSGVLSGSGQLIKQGSGLLALSGNNAYMGPTTVAAGTLAVNGEAVNSAVSVNSGGVLMGTGTVAGLIHVLSGGALAPGYGAMGAGTLFAGNLTFDSGGILDYTLASAPGNSSYLNVAGNVALNGGVTLNISAGAGGLGLGTYPLIGGYSALTGTPSAALTIGACPSSLAGDVFSFTSAGSVIDLVISGSITPVNGQWNVNGSGTWSSSGNWTGSVVPGVLSGTANAAVFGTVLTSGSATVTLDVSPTLASLGFNTTGANSYTLSASNGNTLTLASTAGAATISNSGGSQTIAAPLTLAGSGLSVAAWPGSALTIAGSISQTAAGALNVVGGGEVTLSGTNSYTGGTTLSNGTLQARTPSALPGYASPGNVTLAGGMLAVNVGGANEWTAANVAAVLAAATLPAGSQLGLDASDGSFTYGTNISGPQGLATLGGNALTLAGSNSYTGPTSISGGTLFQLSGSANQTLGGNIGGPGHWSRRAPAS